MFKSLTKNQHLTSGALLVATLVISNFFNFVLSAVLGRVLSLEQFGIFTLFNTLAYFASIFVNSLGGIINYQTAHSFGQGQHRQSADFVLKVIRSLVPIVVVVTLIWLLVSHWASGFFHVKSVLDFLLFTPVFALGLFTAVFKGYLQGNFKFRQIAILLLLESGSKLVAGIILVYFNLRDWVYIVIPISLGLVLLCSWIFVRTRISEDLRSDPNKSGDKDFSWAYFFAAILTGSSAAIFLNMDVVLAKHYLEPAAAGQYAILSLVGKLVFFSTSLFSTFIVSLVRRDEGRLIHPLRNFYLLFSGTLTLAIGSYVGFGLFGNFFIPLLLGNKAHDILPFATPYVLATLGYALAGFIISYHIVRNQYFFSKVSIIFSGAMILGIVVMHDSIAQIVQVFLMVSIGYILAIVILHFLSYISEDKEKYQKPLPVPVVPGSLTVSIGIPAYNEQANIQHLLKSLLEQNAVNFRLEEIIVISDGSTDQTVPIVQSLPDPRIRLVDHKAREGAIVAQNEILSEFKGEILILLNADILIKDELFISRMISPFLTNKKLGLVGAKVSPLRGRGFFERVIVNSSRLRQRIYERISGGDNIYLCQGRARAFSRAFASKLNFPKFPGEDAFSYLKCLELGFEFYYQREAEVFYRCPTNLEDHLRQSVRFMESRKIWQQGLEKTTNNASYYAIPKNILIPAVLKNLNDKPILLAVYLGIFIIASIRAVGYKPTVFWEISTSSKTLVE